MAPEQWSESGPVGRSVGPIYALSGIVTLYEMLTGILHRFQGESYGKALFVQHREAPVPPIPRHLGVPRAVGNVVRRAMAKSPEDRFANAEAMATALEAALTGAASREQRPAEPPVEEIPVAAPPEPQPVVEQEPQAVEPPVPVIPAAPPPVPPRQPALDGASGKSGAGKANWLMYGGIAAAVVLIVVLIAVGMSRGDKPLGEPLIVQKEVTREVPVNTELPVEQAAQTRVLSDASSLQSLSPTALPDNVSPPGKVERPTGGRLVRLFSDPPTLDPHITTDSTSAVIVNEVFGGLVTITPDIEIAPDIAEDWDISPDGKVFTFRLRQDAKFHDGRPVVAEDFRWSLERAADPLTESPVTDLYLGDVIGVADKLNGKAETIQGLRVIDDHTLELTIDAPKSYFLARLTYSTAFVVDRKNVEGNKNSWVFKPNGTGPFRLERYDIGETIILGRNENYHLGPPFFGRSGIHPQRRRPDADV